MNKQRSEVGYVPELDGIRGLACLSVVLLHTLIGIIPLTPSSVGDNIRSFIQPFLVGGVDLFFVLSGFLIGGILIDHKGATNFFRVFWIRRIARIFPVYFILFFSFIIALYVRRKLDVDWLDLWLLSDPLPIWTYATFTQNFALAYANELGPRWIGVTWSLALEEQFYLILPLLVFLLSRRSIVYTAIIAMIVAVFVRTYVWSNYSWLASYVLLPARMDTLMFGLLVSCIVRNPCAFSIAKNLRGKLDIAAIILAAIVAFECFNWVADGLDKTHTSYFLEMFVRSLRYSALAAFYGLIVLRVFLVDDGTFRKVLRSNLLIKTGKISYAMYMYHQAINGCLHGFLFNQAPKVSNSTEFFVAISVIVIAYSLATISMDLFENPIRLAGQKVKYVFKEN